MSQYFPGSDKPLKLLPHQSSAAGSGTDQLRRPAVLLLRFRLPLCVLLLPPPGSYADCTVSSGGSSGGSGGSGERRNSVGPEETLKSFEAKFPRQFKAAKVRLKPRAAAAPLCSSLALRLVWVCVPRLQPCAPACPGCPVQRVQQDAPTAPHTPAPAPAPAPPASQS